jgi:hypothetical protein
MSTGPTTCLTLSQTPEEDSASIAGISSTLSSLLTGVAQSRFRTDEEDFAVVDIDWQGYTVVEDEWPDFPNGTRVISIITDRLEPGSTYNHVIMIDDISRSANVFSGVDTIKTPCVESATHMGMLFVAGEDTVVNLVYMNQPMFDSPTIRPRALTIYGDEKWQIIDSRPSDTLEPRSGLRSPSPE